MAHFAKARARKRRAAPVVPTEAESDRASRPGGRNSIHEAKTPLWGCHVGKRALSGGNMKLILLLAPCVLALWVPLYNSIPPVLFGIPFFYWFQLILIPVSALAIVAADRIGKD